MRRADRGNQTRSRHAGIHPQKGNLQNSETLATKIHPKTKITSGVMSKESKLLIDAFFIKKRKEKQG